MNQQTKEALFAIFLAILVIIFVFALDAADRAIKKDPSQSHGAQPTVIQPSVFLL